MQVFPPSSSTRFFLLFILCSVFQIHQLRAQWEQVDVGYPYGIYSVHYFSETHIFMGGDGDFIKSTNGGQTWEIIDLVDTFGIPILGVLEDLYFETPLIGHAVGELYFGQAEIILKTTNGGVSWQVVNNTVVGGDFPMSFKSFDFWNAFEGICVGTNGQMRKTTNSGNSWNLMNPVTTQDLFGVDFYSTTNGVAVGKNIIIRTTSAGSSWSIISTAYDLTSVFFVNANLGYACGENVILKTTNGGLNWTEVSAIGDFNKVYGSDNTMGYVCGAQTVYRSVNAGTFWTQQTSIDLIAEYHDIDFLDTQSGYIVGSNGIVYHTSNQGDPLPALDAGIVEIAGVDTQYCSAELPVQVKVQNTGAENINSIVLSYSVDGVEQGFQIWSGSLISGQVTDYILMGTPIVDNSAHLVEVNILYVNGQNDNLEFNNSLERSFVSSKLSGTYTIGGTNPDFINLDLALQELEDQGTCDNVEFILRPGTYSENHSLSNFNTGHQLLIRSENLNSESVTITSDGLTFNISNSNNIHFDHLSISTLNLNNRVMSFGLNSSNVVISNCTISGSINTGGTNTSPMISFTSCQNVTLTQNIIQTCGFALSVVNNQGANGMNFIIEENEFFDFNTGAIYLESLHSPIIRKNSFAEQMVAYPTGIAIDIKYCSGESLVFENSLDLLDCSGIHITECNIASEGTTRIYNNEIAICHATTGMTSVGSGIQALDSKNTLIAHNTIQICNESEYVKGVYLTYNPNYPSYGKLINNIIYGPNSFLVYLGSAVTAQYVPSSDALGWLFEEIGGNIFYSEKPFWFFIPDEVNQAGLTSIDYWRTMSQIDSTSLLINPQFSENEGFNIIPSSVNVYMDNAGIELSEVPFDINGIPRSSNPDPGAYEWNTPALNVGIASYTPVAYTCPGMQEIGVELTNYGAEVVTSISIIWSVNGGSNNDFEWVGILEPKDSTNVITLGSANMNPGQNSFHIEILSVNGQADIFGVNLVDVSTSSATYSGNYTVGGINPSFPNLQTALNDLSTGGVCGPVTLNIRPGIYSGQTQINSIPGLSELNTLTIQSEALDTSSVRFTNSLSGATAYVVLIDQADFINLRYLTFTSTGSSSHTVKIQNEAKDITFDHCAFRKSFGALGIWSHIYITGAAACDNLTVRDCLIAGNSFGISDNHTTLADLTKNIRVIRNTFEQQQIMAIDAEFNQNALLDGNTFTKNGSGNLQTAVLIKSYFTFTFINNEMIGNIITGLDLMMNNPVSCIVANNLIRTTSSGSIGLVLSSDFTTPYHSEIIHNTIKIDHVSGSYAIKRNGEAFVVQNNILAATHSNALYHSPSGYYSGTDYNIYWNQGVNPFSITIPAGWGDPLPYWTLMKGVDQHSYVVNPAFVSGLDLHLNQFYPAFGNANPEFLPIVPLDIDGDQRSTSPDIGADEFFLSSIPNDLGIILGEFDDGLCSGEKILRALLKNDGSNTVEQANIHWSVNGQEGDFVWFGNLLPGMQEWVDLTMVEITPAAQYDIEIWCENPNESNDLNATNNLVSLIITNSSLSGVITVGSGMNFSTIAAAVTFISTAQLCGPVELVLSPGTYQSIVLTSLLNTSAEFPLTVRSSNGQPSSVVLTGIGANYTVNLGNAAHITFRDITIESGGANTAVFYCSACHDLSFINCVFPEGAKEDLGYNLLVENCSITGEFNLESYADYGFVFRNNSVAGMGLRAANPYDGIIENNIFNTNSGDAIVISGGVPVYIRNNRLEGAGSIVANGLSIVRYARIYNNEIIQSTATNAIRGGEFSYIAFNTIRHAGTNYAIKVQGQKCILTDNIVHCTSSNKILDVSSQSQIVFGDFNNYSGNGSLNFKVSSSTYLSFAAYLSAQAWDDHSTTYLPNFVSSTDSHVLDESLMGTGFPQLYVQVDKDLNPRDPILPTIGAFEGQAPEQNPGDLNGDGIVSTADVLELLGGWGCAGVDCPGDVNGDGITNIYDLFILLGLL